MRIVAISDLHGNLPIIPEGDLLLIAGDICRNEDFAPSNVARRDWQRAWLKGDFYNWLCMQKMPVVGIAGNHDFGFQTISDTEIVPSLPWNYLHHDTIEIQGLKIFGAPWTKRLGMWAFEVDPSELYKKWEEIPKDVDIIMVHGPVYGFGDLLDSSKLWEGEDPHTGCQNLLQRIVENQFPNLKAVITGHIHESYGMVETHGIKFINPSHMDGEFNPVNPPILFEL